MSCFIHIHTIIPSKQKTTKQTTQLSADEDQGTRVPSARDRQDEIAQHHDGFQSDQKFPSEAPEPLRLQASDFVETTKTDGFPTKVAGALKKKCW